MTTRDERRRAVEVLMGIKISEMNALQKRRLLYDHVFVNAEGLESNEVVWNDMWCNTRPAVPSKRKGLPLAETIMLPSVRGDRAAKIRVAFDDRSDDFSMTKGSIEWIDLFLDGRLIGEYWIPEWMEIEWGAEDLEEVFPPAAPSQG